MGGLGVLLWKISVAVYLIANGMLGLLKEKGGDFEVIFGSVFKGDVSVFVIIASVISLIAGIAVVLEMLNIEVSIRDTLTLVIAIIWAVYVVIGVISWVTSGFDNFWYVLQRLGVHVMVLASLMIASKKFD